MKGNQLRLPCSLIAAELDQNKQTIICCVRDDTHAAEVKFVEVFFFILDGV